MEQEKIPDDYFVKAGEKSPYASLLVDLAFKKAFNPDVEASRQTLVDMLNDILGPQLERPIKSVVTRNVEQNQSGSPVHRTAIFDLSCADEEGHPIEIEVQIRKMDNLLKRLGFYASQLVCSQGVPGDEWNFDVKPTYVVAFTAHNAFDDDHIIHRLTTMDIETHEKALDSYNYTIIELAKVLPKRPRTAVEKWAFLFKYLNRLARRPAELKDKRFDHLFSCATVSKFTAEEYKEYEKLHNLEFEHNAMAAGFFEEFAAEVKEREDKVREEGHEEGREEGRNKERQETALTMLADNEPMEKICKFSRLSVTEILELKKGLDNPEK